MDRPGCPRAAVGRAARRLRRADPSGLRVVGAGALRPARPPVSPPTSSTSGPRRRCPSRARSGREPGPPRPDHRPALVPAGRLLRGPRPRASSTPTTTAPATSPGLAGQARLPRVARRRLPLAAALLPVAPARRRLRHQRLLHRPPRATATSTTLADFLEEAHRRGIRVIADLVMNHTSDQHPWFEESRSVARQPQGRLVRLERRRPALARGPDHLRRHRAVQLDLRPPSAASTTGTASSAISPTSTTTTPRSQTPCSTSSASGSTSASTGSASTPCPTSSSGTGPRGENLPETHDFLQRGCARRSTPPTPAGCCWPRPTSGRPTSSTTSATATSATCASTSRSCPACSWRSAGSSGYPITEILAQTPEIPDGCQWGIFLRNHDELTLEMVTDEERDYMYGRVRQGPADEAATSGSAGAWRPCSTTTAGWPSCSTPCSSPCRARPIIYYGDEIGMGDNIYLGDRDSRAHPDAVDPRPQRRLLSRADFAQLYLPPLMDPVYGFQAVNVEAQHAQPELVPALDAPHAARAPPAPGVRHRQLRGDAVSTTRRSSPTSAPGPNDPRRRATNRSRSATPSSASTTSPGSRSPSSCPCPGSRAAGRSSCSAGSRSHRSANCRTSLTLAPYGFFWFDLSEVRAQ